MAMDVNTWPSVFSRHSTVNQPQRGLDALSFVRRVMITDSNDGSLIGFDGMGPVSVWNEGTAQYVAAGGPDSELFLNNLLSQQHTDGSMPNSPDNWGTPWGWLSTMSGL